jgi:choline dehydrogenase-like flavoprotein
MDHPSVSVTATPEEPTNQSNIGWVSSRSDQFYDHEEPIPGSFHLTFGNTAKSTTGGAQQKRPTASKLLAIAGDPTPETILDTVRDPFGETPLGDDLEPPSSAGAPYPISIRGAGEMLPRADNRVTLDRSKTDDHGRPVPSIHLEDGEHERATMARCLEVQRSIMDELGATITEESTLEGRSMSTHHMGTTRMGTDPSKSVVNAECRTHDLRNLWIASSSVFTTGGANNPTLTIAALALKTAEHIDAEL